MFCIITHVTVVLAVVIAAMLRRGDSRGHLETGRKQSARFPRLESLAALVVWLSFIPLAVTGFCAVCTGHHLGGYSVLLHVGAGVAFSSGMVALLLFRASALGVAEAGKPQYFSTVQKLSFWALAACTSILILSVVMAMLHLWGTEGQHMALLVHRYTALASLLAAIVYGVVSVGR